MLFIRRAYFLGLFFLFFIFSSFYQFDLESSKYNYFVFEDSSGKIWISSEEGWTKFNGERKINYWANETDGFEGQYIQSNIFEDSSQNLYFTTYEYLIQYNPKLNVFKSFQLFEDENVEYSIVAINASNNQLYLTVNRMLVIYDFRIQKIIKIINDDVKSKRFAISSDYKFIVGCPWINDEGIEIFKFENGDWVKRELVENVKIPGLDLESKIQNAIIDGNIIWSLGKNFIYKIDRQKNIILEKFDFDSDTNFNDFILYSNYLIIATKNEGLLKFDKNSGLLLSPQLFKKFSGKSISRINLLSDDKLMLSFPNEGVQSVDLEMLSDRIDEIDGPLQFIDHRDKNIIGVSKNGTFFLLDSLNNVLSKKSLSNLTSNSIIDITYDNENGAVYFMTRSSVFQLIDDSTDFERLSSYADRQLYSFGKCDGKITINSSSGVWDLNKDTTSSIAQFKCNNSEVIYSYGNEEGSQFWTCSNNTFYYKTKKETFKFDCSGFINDIYYNDELVIISNSIGVDLFKRKEQEYIHSVFSNCEFNNKQFFGCTKSKNGYYIFTSEEGLIVSDEHFNNYFIEEIEFDLDNKAPFTSNGFDVYFSSLSGVHLLDESKFKDIKKKNILHIESILVDGQKYSNLKANFIDTINIDYSKKNIQLEIDIANFESSSNNYIGYKYDGIDSQWRCNSTLQPLDLPVFKYGKFQLVIQYFNGSYLIDEKKMTINISPPFHQTWWFRFLAALTFIGIGFGINFYQTKKKLRAKQIELDRQKALQSQRNRMSHDLHDEMGSGLSTIRYITKSLEKEQSQQKVLQIEKIASSLIQNMRDLLWSLDESNDTVAGWHSKVRQTINQMCRNTDLKNDIQLTKENNNLVINGIIRRNLILVLKESINNVLKHANAEKITVSTVIEDNQLFFIISDDGSGFDTSSKMTVQNKYGLKSMNERVEQLKGTIDIVSNNNGTTLKITIPLIAYD